MSTSHILYIGDCPVISKSEQYGFNFSCDNGFEIFPVSLTVVKDNGDGTTTVKQRSLIDGWEVKYEVLATPSELMEIRNKYETPSQIHFRTQVSIGSLA
jgi:hypothetical protein